MKIRDSEKQEDLIKLNKSVLVKKWGWGDSLWAVNGQRDWT